MTGSGSKAAAAVGTVPLDHPATYADLRDLLPEARAEVFDGVLSLSPGASFARNRCARRIANLLEEAAAPHGYAVGTDNDVRWAENRITRPDVFVITASHAETNPMPVTETPLVVVEILSAASASRDFVEKRMYAEAARVHEYWVVNLDTSQLIRHCFAGPTEPYTVTAFGSG